MALSEQTHSAQASGKTAARLSALADLAGLRHRLALPVLFYFLAVLLPISFNLGPMNMTGVRLVLIIMVIPLTLRLLGGAYGKLLLTDVMFLLHVVWMAITLFINNPEQALANAGSTGIEFFGGYVLGRAYIRSREDFVGMIRLIAFVIICCLPFAIYEAMTSVSPLLRLLNALPGLRSLPDVDIGTRMGLYRTQFVFAHPIHFGLFCAIMLPLCWVGMKGIYGETTRFGITLLVACEGLLSLSSGALLAYVLQIGLIGWALMFRKSDRRWTILVALFAVAYVVVDLLSNRTPIMVFLSYATFSPHTAYWRTIIFDYGMQNIWANPLFGIGLNDWFRPSYMHSGSVDNFWLLTAMRYGIPGFAFLAIGYLTALWKIGRRPFDDDIALWQFRRAWMFSFVGLTFTLCTVHVWHNLFSFVFFMFGTGIWLLTAEPQRAAQVHPATGEASRPGRAPLSFSRLKPEQISPRKDAGQFARKEDTPDPSGTGRQPRYSRFEPPGKSDTRR